MSAAKDEVQDFSLNYVNVTVADTVFSESSDREDNYVVLFAGGYSADANRPYYYENIKGMYELLSTQYSIDPSNIYILYADGMNDGVDNSLGLNSDMSFASSSTVLAATEENLKNVFAEISVKADSNDHFLFYSFDHGAETADGTDYLCGWDCMIKDTDFAAYASIITAGYQTYLMSQCYAWGMLEDITVTDNMFLGGSSAENKESHMAADNKNNVATAGFAFAVEEALKEGISDTHGLYDYTYENNRYAIIDGQQMAGADILDVNVGIPEIDEVSVLPKVVLALQRVTDLPLQLDSANPMALSAAARVYNGIPIIN
jgi:hypothetical protein